MEFKQKTIHEEHEAHEGKRKNFVSLGVLRGFINNAQVRRQ
jgi:hypothetical protein